MEHTSLAPGSIARQLYYKATRKLAFRYPWLRSGIMQAEKFWPVSGREFYGDSELAFSLTPGSSARRCPLPEKTSSVVFSVGSGLGDALVMTPTIAALKARYPNINTALVVNAAFFPLLEGIPGLDRLIPIDFTLAAHPKENSDQTYLRRVIGTLSAEPGFDVYVFNALSKWINCWEGLARKGGAVFAGVVANPHPGASVIAVRNRGILATFSRPVYIGISWGLALLCPFFRDWDFIPAERSAQDDLLSPNINPNLTGASQLEAVREKLAGTVDFSRPVIFVNPLARYYARTLPLAGAQELIAGLAKRYPEAEIVIDRGADKEIIGHPTKQTTWQYIEELRARLPAGQAVKVLPPLTLAEVTAVMYLSDHIVSVDTGLVHICAAKVFNGKPCTMLAPGAGSREWFLDKPGRAFIMTKGRFIPKVLRHVAETMEMLVPA